MVGLSDQSFYSLFADMAGKGIVVSVELKNGVVLQGKLASVDKYMNFNLYELNVDVEKWPQFVSDCDARQHSRTASSEAPR